MIQRPFRNIGEELRKAMAKLSPAARKKLLDSMSNCTGPRSFGAGPLRWRPDAEIDLRGAGTDGKPRGR